MQECLCQEAYLFKPNLLLDHQTVSIYHIFKSQTLTETLTYQGQSICKISYNQFKKKDLMSNFIKMMKVDQAKIIFYNCINSEKDKI